MIFIFSILLFANPVFGNLKEKQEIYIFQRPPFSYSGTISKDGYYYYFTNNRSVFHLCDIKINGGCFIKTNVRPKIIKKGIIKVENSYACSEKIISKSINRNPKSKYFLGYGICRKNGWEKVENPTQ